MTPPQKYQRCMVMAGGGFRFGYYLGIYAALRHANKTPDLLLASCGGAIAAALIQSLPDDTRRKDWISSPEMFQFWCGLRSSRQATILRAFLSAMKRRIFIKNAVVIPDLFNDFMFDVPASLPLPDAFSANTETAVAIIAGQLLFAENEVGQARGNRKLFAETVFCAPRAAELLRDMRSPLSLESFGNNAIASDLLTDVNTPIAEAVRASISDMFYFRCHTYQAKHYIGGVIDLFPIEVARQLADQVVMELKGPYDQMYSIPALHAVLGIDGNHRLEHVLQQYAEHWIDTSDMEQVLLENQIDKKIVWRRNKLELSMPKNYEAYLKMIDAQWQYGYQRGVAGLAHSG